MCRNSFEWPVVTCNVRVYSHLWPLFWKTCWTDAQNKSTLVKVKWINIVENFSDFSWFGENFHALCTSVKFTDIIQGACTFSKAEVGALNLANLVHRRVMSIWDHESPERILTRHFRECWLLTWHFLRCCLAAWKQTALAKLVSNF